MSNLQNKQVPKPYLISEKKVIHQVATNTNTSNEQASINTQLVNYMKDYDELIDKLKKKMITGPPLKINIPSSIDLYNSKIEKFDTFKLIEVEKKIQENIQKDKNESLIEKSSTQKKFTVKSGGQNLSNIFKIDSNNETKKKKFLNQKTKPEYETASEKKDEKTTKKSIKNKNMKSLSSPMKKFKSSSDLSSQLEIPAILKKNENYKIDDDFAGSDLWNEKPLENPQNQAKTNNSLSVNSNKDGNNKNNVVNVNIQPNNNTILNVNLNVYQTNMQTNSNQAAIKEKNTQNLKSDSNSDQNQIINFITNLNTDTNSNKANSNVVSFKNNQSKSTKDETLSWKETNNPVSLNNNKNDNLKNKNMTDISIREENNATKDTDIKEIDSLKKGLLKEEAFTFKSKCDDCLKLIPGSHFETKAIYLSNKATIEILYVRKNIKFTAEVNTSIEVTYHEKHYPDYKFQRNEKLSLKKFIETEILSYYN